MDTNRKKYRQKHKMEVAGYLYAPTTKNTKYRSESTRSY